MMALEHAGIDRQRLVLAAPQPLSLLRQSGHQVEHRAGQSWFHEAVEGAAQRIVIRGFCQSDVGQPLWRVDQQRLDTAKTLALMLPQHETGKQLSAAEVLSTEAACVGR